MDLVLGHAEPVRGHLRIGRLVPLPVRQGAGDDRQFARGVEAQFHPLVEDAGIVDIIDDAAAAVFAGGFALRAPRGIAVPIRQSLAFGHRRSIVAGVVDPAGARLVGIGVRADQVLLAQFGRVDAHFTRRLIDEPLHDIDGLGAAGAAIRVGRRGIGKDETARHRDRRYVVNGRGEL